MAEVNKRQTTNEQSVIEHAENCSEISEKHDHIEEDSHIQGHAIRTPSDEDKVTWKTWCVIVVCL